MNAPTVAEHRECFTWCPHGTFNPNGCGLCLERRRPFAEIGQLRARVDELEAEVDNLRHQMLG